MLTDTQPTAQQATLTTRWTEEAAVDNPHQEYPRPQLVRDEWMNLNGMWDYAIVPASDEEWSGSQGQIRVPFPVESHLSGVQKRVTREDALWYRRTFEIPEDWNQRVQLNFGAVDWTCSVYVNGQRAGDHTGGYDPFSIDITDHLKSGENTITMRVWDPTDQGYQPVGKQRMNPEGIWYTPVTGIWQTVWLEPVPTEQIVSNYAVTETNGNVRLVVESTTDQVGTMIKGSVSLRGKHVMDFEGDASTSLEFHVPNAELWTPERPSLYDVELRMERGGQVLDEVRTYFAIREFSLEHTLHGPHLALNGEPIFMYGPLDQGWWPDGLYTAPTDEAMRYDLEITKRMGFNAVRKHVKTEPARWYRYCDEMGLIVWQDMPNGDRSPQWNRDWSRENPTPDADRSDQSASNYRVEWKEIIDSLRFFPSIAIWIPFNEAWGQFETKDITQWTKAYDPTRLVNPASGGNFVSAGDMLDIHEYPGPASPDPLEDRAIVLGEFGGLGLPLEGHLWQKDRNWGYQSYADRQNLIRRYKQLIDALHILRGKTGLSAAIYTQTTDVEGEVNGLMTYDRSVIKFPIDDIYRINTRLYGTPPKFYGIAPTADDGPARWHYTEREPALDWHQASFDDSDWKEGPGGFGTEGTPGARIGTEWSGNNIWVRRTFRADGEDDVWLKIHHDEDAVVYLNGVKVAELDSYTSDYMWVRLDGAVLKDGDNLLAISCRQTRGGQFIDAGIYRQMSGD